MYRHAFGLDVAYLAYSLLQHNACEKSLDRKDRKNKCLSRLRYGTWYKLVIFTCSSTFAQSPAQLTRKRFSLFTHSNNFFNDVSLNNSTTFSILGAQVSLGRLSCRSAGNNLALFRLYFVSKGPGIFESVLCLL